MADFEQDKGKDKKEKGPMGDGEYGTRRTACEVMIGIPLKGGRLRDECLRKLEKEKTERKSPNAPSNDSPSAAPSVSKESLKLSLNGKELDVPLSKFSADQKPVAEELLEIQKAGGKIVITENRETDQSTGKASKITYSISIEKEGEGLGDGMKPVQDKKIDWIFLGADTNHKQVVAELDNLRKQHFQAPEKK